MNENKELSAQLAAMSADRTHQEEPQPEQSPDESVSTSAEATADRQNEQLDQNTNDVAPQQTISDQPLLRQGYEGQAVVVPQQPQKESGHFKKLREAYEKSEREKEQLYELLLQYKNQSQPQKTQEPDLDANDYVHRGYVDKRMQEAQERTAQYQQILYEQMVANQLKSQHSDFDQVVSSENIARLREEHPEIAASLAANPDIASKAQATYKIMKKLGISAGTPDYEPIKQKIQANAQKPRPATTSPLSYANSYDYQRMSEDDMKREREAMERDIRG